MDETVVGETVVGETVMGEAATPSRSGEVVTPFAWPVAGRGQKVP